MARSFSIVQISPSGAPGSPAVLKIAGNLVSSFQGKFYRQQVSPFATQAFYTSGTTPVGYDSIVATTFEVTNNASYAGKYTVYTPVSLLDSGTNPSSQFISGSTEIRVNETVGSALTIGDVTTGKITNISTYLIPIAGESSVLIPPGVTLTNRPIELTGRNVSPWGESYSQNLIDLAQNFSSGTAPTSPYIGQTWFNSIASTLNVRTSSGWVVVSSGSSYRHTQNTPSTSWNVLHSLGLVAPFVGIVQVFIDTGVAGYKIVSPLDVTFSSANQLLITFTTSQTGIVLVQA